MKNILCNKKPEKYRLEIRFLALSQIKKKKNYLKTRCFFIYQYKYFIFKKYKNVIVCVCVCARVVIVSV